MWCVNWAACHLASVCWTSLWHAAHGHALAEGACLLPSLNRGSVFGEGLHNWYNNTVVVLKTMWQHVHAHVFLLVATCVVVTAVLLLLDLPVI
jgi:hypothetical protein